MALRSNTAKCNREVIGAGNTKLIYSAMLMTRGDAVVTIKTESRTIPMAVAVVECKSCASSRLLVLSRPEPRRHQR